MVLNNPKAAFNILEEVNRFFRKELEKWTA
jgi:hypothetical protein